MRGMQRLLLLHTQKIVMRPKLRCLPSYTHCFVGKNVECVGRLPKLIVRVRRLKEDDLLTCHSHGSDI